MEQIQIRDTGKKSSDPGWKKLRSGIRDGKNSDPGCKNPDPRSGIRDKHPWSATLVLPVLRNIILLLVQRERLWGVPLQPHGAGSFLQGGAGSTEQGQKEGWQVRYSGFRCQHLENSKFLVMRLKHRIFCVEVVGPMVWNWRGERKFFWHL